LDKRRIAVTSIIVFILGVLVFLQVRQWRHFDWITFWNETRQSSLKHIFHACAYIYLADVLRAWRWQVFLRPRKGSWLQLISPTFIGFTGLALLGRPGEFIRPFLIARRTNLPFSSQIAVWTVERIFDIGAFTVMMVAAIYFAPGLKELPFYAKFREAGYILVLLVLGMILSAALIARNGEHLARWFEQKFASSTIVHKIGNKIREFGLGLNTIHGPWAFFLLSFSSIIVWFCIALAYREVTHSYHVPILRQMTTSHVLLLMGASMVGSVLQLPAVGGGSQLATIGALNHVYDVPRELAVSCGMLLWLTTFMSIIPLGLWFAHREHVSLRRLSQESVAEEEKALKSETPAGRAD
jgi:hypothetical protein